MHIEPAFTNPDIKPADPAKLHADLKKDLAAKIKINRPGWYALRHKDGWWVGGAAGVTCYRTRPIAAYALTLAWQRDGGKQLNFKVDRYPGDANVDAGTYTPALSAVDAIQKYESKT